MNPDLDQLIRLQEVDLKAAELRKRLHGIPAELERLAKIEESERRALEEVEKKLEQIGPERRRLESEVDELRSKRSKYKSQLMDVKTNKEYQAMLHEIESVERHIGEHEDRVLELMLLADDLKAEGGAARGEFGKRLEELGGDRQSFIEFETQAALLLEAYQEERELLASQISPSLMAEYAKLTSSHKNGIALAEARDQSCQACHVKLRPQVFAEVRSSRVILHCDSCYRILYYQPPPPPPIEATAAAES